MPVVTTNSDGVPLVAFALLDGEGRTLASRDADEIVYAASTVKLGIMLAAVRAAEVGELSLEDPVECRRRFVSHGSGRAFSVDPEDADPSFPADGSSATVGELVRWTICRSSNEATNLLFDLLGPERIAAAFDLCAAHRTRMERRIGDLEARDTGLTNVTTAGDLARIMAAIVSGAVANGEHTAWMRRILSDQEHLRIATVLPPGLPWGSKSGDVPGIEHDAAFVGDPASPGIRYLAVCTRGFEPPQGRTVIAALAAALLSQA